jgi:hypothetical protein
MPAVGKADRIDEQSHAENIDDLRKLQVGWSRPMARPVKGPMRPRATAEYLDT